MKKPWNRVDLPVYSISSQSGDQSNMHIITYLNAVSMHPKLYIAGIYEGTRTLELIEQNPHFIVQLLSAGQYNLVKLLGQQSGHNIDKIARLEKRGLLQRYQNFPVLKDALAWMEMKARPVAVPVNSPQPDHRLYLCELVSYRNNTDEQPLTLNILREKKIVRM